MTIALLTPAPSIHVEIASQQAMSTIALGTRATDVLERFAEISHTDAFVLIYQSHTPGPLDLVVSRIGVFGGYEHAAGNGVVPATGGGIGRHP